MSHFKQPHEALSAVMDGEASEFETHKICKQLLSDPETLAKWQRYRRVSSLLGDATRPFAHLDIATSVRSTVAAEPVYTNSDEAGVQVPAVRHKSALFKSLSVAASVALAVLVGVKYVPDLLVSDQTPVIAASDHPMQQRTPVTTSSSVNVPVIVNNRASVASHERSSGNLRQSQSQLVGLNALRSRAVPEAGIASKEQRSDALSQSLGRFRHYLLEHAQQSARVQGQGLIPFAKVLKLGEAENPDLSTKASQQ